MTTIAEDGTEVICTAIAEADHPDTGAIKCAVSVDGVDYRVTLAPDESGTLVIRGEPWAELWGRAGSPQSRRVEVTHGEIDAVTLAAILDECRWHACTGLAPGQTAQSTWDGRDRRGSWVAWYEVIQTGPGHVQRRVGCRSEQEAIVEADAVRAAHPNASVRVARTAAWRER